MKRVYHLYIMSSKSGILYVGVTGNLSERVNQHKTKINPSSFSGKYNCNELVYYEEFEYVLDAIAREKQLKKWRREKKISLIYKLNPKWKDLSEEWFTD